LEDLFLGSQWSIILGYIWLSVKFFLRLEVRQITKDKTSGSKRMIGKGLTVPWKIEHFCLYLNSIGAQSSLELYQSLLELSFVGLRIVV